MHWGSVFLVGLAIVQGIVVFFGFLGHRRKTDRDIEDRLAAIEQLVGELSGDDLTRPPPREVRITGQAVPKREGALNPRG